MAESWIKYGSVKFGTHDMYDEFGLRVLDCDYDYILPTLRQRKKTIPLRSGVYQYDEKYYDERPIKLTVRAENDSARGFWREVSYVLSKRSSIYIYDEPDKYYTGRIYDPSALKRVRNIGMDLDLVFLCEPFAYGESHTQNFNNLTLHPNYTGTAPTPTYIIIENVGNKNAVNIQIKQIISTNE